MRTGISSHLLAAALALSCMTAGAESLSTYFSTCKSELEFSGSDIPTDLNCNDASIFATPSDVLFHAQTNDAVGYEKINENVDLLFACRWLQNGKRAGDWSIKINNLGDAERVPPFVLAASVEMLIHNRKSGKTCFFKAKERDMRVPGGGMRWDATPVAVVSPAASGASDYWTRPDDLSQQFECANCHRAGPYIATPRIAPFLSRYGLLNNGHDVFLARYQAVGSTFRKFNDTIFGHTTGNPCATACHVIAADTLATGVNFADILLPGIGSVVDNDFTSIEEISVRTSGAMPPTDPYSPYRWINRDRPSGSGDGERLTDVQAEYPALYCRNPKAVQAHVVGSDFTIDTDELAGIPDRLERFSLRDGLLCRADEQSDGQCNDYKTRYKCDGRWTSWLNDDEGTTGNGDFEQRSKFPDLCDKPTAIQARTTVMVWEVVTTVNTPPTPIYGWVPRTRTFNGPHDRIRTFDTRTGFVCLNEDQPSGSCSDYVVRYICN